VWSKFYSVIKKARKITSKPNGMIFTLYGSNDFIMNDILLLMGITVGTYLLSLGFAIILLRLFFPLKTKEEMERIKIVSGASANQQTVPELARISFPLLKRRRQLA